MTSLWKTLTTLTAWVWGVGNQRRRRLAQYRRALNLTPEKVTGWSNQAHQVTQATNATNISVLITCFNYENYIQRALHSAIEAAAFISGVEIIVVDDHSTDRSPDRIRNTARETHIPVSVLRTDWNVGVSQARNVGLHQARGEFVFILDADNTVHPNALKNLWQRAKQEMVDAVYGPIQRVHLDGSLDQPVSHLAFDPRRLITEGNYIDAMALFRRESLLEIGGYDIELLPVIGGWEDYAVWLEFASRGFYVAFEPQEVGTYLVKPDSMVKRIKPADMQAALAIFQDRYLHRIQTQWP